MLFIRFFFFCCSFISSLIFFGFFSSSAKDKHEQKKKDAEEEKKRKHLAELKRQRDDEEDKKQYQKLQDMLQNMSKPVSPSPLFLPSAISVCVFSCLAYSASVLCVFCFVFCCCFCLFSSPILLLFSRQNQKRPATRDRNNANNSRDKGLSAPHVSNSSGFLCFLFISLFLPSLV
jgi:Flp pilus assembly protein TadB